MDGGIAMSDATERAASPEDLTRLFVDRANAGDADGLADLYEPDAVMAYPPGRETVGPGGHPRGPGPDAGPRPAPRARAAAAHGPQR